VSHSGLEKCLQVRIKDPSFLLLIRRFLKAGYFERARSWRPSKNAARGNLSQYFPISSCTMCWTCGLRTYQAQVRGVCFLVRYADDFICMVQYQDDALHILEALRERFTQFDLALHPEKTRVISFGRYERQNAHGRSVGPNTFDFLGFTHYCDRSRRGKFIVGHQTSRKKFRKKCGS